MKVFSSGNFFRRSIFFAAVVFLTVSAQHAYRLFIEHKLNTTESILFFVSDFESTLNIFEDINRNEISNGFPANANPQADILISKIERFTNEKLIVVQHGEVRVPVDLINKFQNSTDENQSLDGNLTDLAYRIKHNNDLLQTSITNVRRQLNTIEQEVVAYNEELFFRKNISHVLLYLLLIFELIFFITSLKVNFFNKLNDSLLFAKELSRGSINDHELEKTRGQFGLLFDKLNLINSIIRTATHYIEDLAAGNSEADHQNEIRENELMKSISGLAQQIVKTKKQEEERSWMNTGIAKFGEILQNQDTDLNTFGDRIISELAKYTGANQGALFTMVATNEGNGLELLSTYAWGKKRFVEKKVMMESGNLMTQAIKGGEYIYLKEIPDNFVNITSGLGDANPKAIIIIPLISNNEPLGVIELASFTEFESHKIDLITKVCENVSSTLSAISTAASTKQLLQSSQAMTEQLRAQEEELRQNAEELEASRENLHRELELAKEEMQQQLQTIEGEKLKNIAILEGCVDGVVIFKEDGIVEFFNKSAEEIWGISREEINGKSIDKLLPIEILHKHNESVLYYKGQGQFKQIDVRTEITTYNHLGEEISLLVTASQGSVRGTQTYAFFVQTITVELF